MATYTENIIFIYFKKIPDTKLNVPGQFLNLKSE